MANISEVFLSYYIMIYDFQVEVNMKRIIPWILFSLCAAGLAIFSGYYYITQKANKNDFATYRENVQTTQTAMQLSIDRSNNQKDQYIQGYALELSQAA